MNVEGMEETQQDPVVESVGDTTDVVVETPTVEELTEGYSPETIDLLDALSTEEQEKCGETVVENFERDEKSSQKWRDRHAQILRLALGDLPPPEEGSFAKARIHYAIIMTACIRIGARIYDQQFPSSGEFFGVRPTDALDLARSVRVAKHLNWIILHKIPEYVPNHDALIRQWLLYGSAFTYVFWDPVQERIRHEVCSTEDIVIQYSVRRGSVDPSLADIPRITRKVRKYRHELEAMADVGYYKHVDELFEDEQSDSDVVAPVVSAREESKNHPIQEVVDRDAGQTRPANEAGAPRLLLEQHCWYKFPKTKRERPVVITVDKATKKLLCIRLRENEDPEDQARYNREKQAAQAQYDLAMQKYAMDIAAYEAGQQSLTPPPIPGEMTQTAPPMPGAMDQTAPPMPGEMTPSVPVDAMMPPPVQPAPPPEPPPPKMVPIHYFTHYICEPNPEGVYGFGVGSLLEGNNLAADVMASQVIDAATLANTVTGIKSREAKIRGGDLEIAPGVVADCDLMPGELRDAFHFFQFKGPDPAMGKLIQEQKDDAEGLSSAGDILSGEVGGSNETATTTQIRVGEASRQIAIWNKRYTRARTCEGQKIARLCSVYTEDKEYFTQVDPFKMIPGSDAEVTFNDDGQPELPGMKPTQISRMDYLEDVDITITADPRMASQAQRIQEAMQTLQIVGQLPPLAMNPVLMSALARNLFVAMDRPDLIRAVESAPPPPQMPGGPGGAPGGPPGGPNQPPGPPSGPPKRPSPGNQPPTGQELTT